MNLQHKPQQAPAQRQGLALLVNKKSDTSARLSCVMCPMFFRNKHSNNESGYKLSRNVSRSVFCFGESLEKATATSLELDSSAKNSCTEMPMASHKS